MSENDKEVLAFIDLIQRRYGKRLEYAEAHALYLRLITLYRVLIKQSPNRSDESASHTARKAH